MGYQIAGRLGALIRWCYAVEAWCIQAYWRARLQGTCGRLSVGEGFRAYNPERITVGDDVAIGRNVILRALTHYPWSDPPQQFEPHLEIGPGCFISHGAHLSCVEGITLGPRVMIADHVYVADHDHDYRAVDIPIKQQALIASGPVTIGADSWIGANACITGGVRIGRHCVIGAQSVVTKDIPDFSVAVGAPARVVKQFDAARGEWVAV